jgi:glucose/arabinose dehydrogenase
MRQLRTLKLAAVALFVAVGVVAFLPNERNARANSFGPIPGRTGAPGEDTCRECHLPEDGIPPGTITISAPQTYVPGQTYQITVNVTNADPARRRWGFQLTAIDDTGNRAGTLQAGPEGLTQVIAGTLGTPARQYVEHTTPGSFEGQSNGASWTFNWTAPAESVGPVLLHTAANQANGDHNTSGDSINFTFASIQPEDGQPTYTLTVTPSAQIIPSGSSASYTVTVTPSNGFTGTVALSLAGLPTGASAVFNPATVNITNTSAQTNTLTITNGTATPLGRFPLTLTGTSGNNTRTAPVTLVTGPTMTDAGLTVRQLASGLSQPTALAFLGAGDLLVLEKATGKVLRVTNGVVQPTPALDLGVNSFSERGLLGIALHPQFPANPRVYLYWTESSTGADTENADEVPLRGNRVDSFLWNGSTLAFEKNLITLHAFQQDAGQPSRGNHNGGVIRFGPDGKLYVIIGDNGRRGNLQNLRYGPSATPEGPAVADDQFGGPAPDKNHLTGVILRLNDDGTTPSDNPFVNIDPDSPGKTASAGKKTAAPPELAGKSAGNVQKVFAYGIRNSFGMAFDPVSGYLWTQENGDDSFDEINRVEAGFDGGWIQLMGPSSRVAEFKQIEVSRGDSLQQNRWLPDQIADTPAQALARLYVLPGSHYTEPEFSWKYAVAPSPIGFVRGNGLGASFAGDLLVGASRTTLAGGYLFRFELTQDRRHLSLTEARLADTVADNLDKFDLTESESLLIGRDFGITTDIETAPDGNVLVLSLSNGAIYELSAKPGSTQPASVAAETSDAQNIDLPLRLSDWVLPALRKNVAGGGDRAKRLSVWWE